MTKQRINVLRMADYLWERYTRAGLIHFATITFRNHAQNEAYIDKISALKSTALHTYLQFCKKHNLTIGYRKELS